MHMTSCRVGIACVCSVLCSAVRSIRPLASIANDNLLIMVTSAAAYCVQARCELLLSGSAWYKDLTACVGGRLRDSGWGLGQTASQHSGRPPAHMRLHVRNMEAGECTHHMHTHKVMPLYILQDSHVTALLWTHAASTGPCCGDYAYN